MVITVDEMFRLGTVKLLDYLGLWEEEELATWMIENNVYTLDLVAQLLREDSEICEHCGENYGHMEEGGMCTDCLDYIACHPKWE